VGLIAGFQQGRARKKIDNLLDTLGEEIAAITDSARSWYAKTLELRWTQAEILQVMEEIERVGRDSVMAYFAARHNLDRLYNHLIRATTAAKPFPANLPLINNALCDVESLIEADIARAVVNLSNVAAEDEKAVRWLKAGHYADWETELTGRTGDALNVFLERFGHRGLGEGEMCMPRWREEPEAVLRAVLACVEYHPKLPAKVPAVNNTQKLLDHVGGPDKGKAQKEARDIVCKLRGLEQFQSKTLHAIAYVWAGARRWATAAAREALADGRILEPQDIFYFDLEEIKQMMTGELNISDADEIRATCARRKAEHKADQVRSPGEILLGEAGAIAKAGQAGGVLEAWPAHKGLPAVPGRVVGPLRRWAGHKGNGFKEAIIGADAFDGGWSLTLPVADGFVAATGTPIDPFVAAARAWHHPAIVGLGETYAALVEGAQTTVDGDAITVQQ
jgi:pyruvate,water dikinase